MCLPIGFEIHYFIYFPTPLYTKTRCQAGFCVCWGFFFLKKQWQTMYSTHRAAAFGCDPTRENASPESPQTFRACSISKYYFADDSRSTEEAI